LAVVIENTSSAISNISYLLIGTFEYLIFLGLRSVFAEYP